MVVRIARGLMFIGILLATARGAEADPSNEVVKDLKAAFKAGDQEWVTKALARTAEVRWKVPDKKLGHLLRAIDVGIKHEDPTIALASIRTLVEMRIPGSSRYLNPRLAVPTKVGAKYWNVHLAAIRAAGELHEAGSIPRLFRLVDHPKVDMAAAAVEALGQYRSLVPKERKKLIGKVANAMAKFERKKPKGMQDRIRIERVTKTLIESVRSLTGDRTLATADEVRVWLRESGKPPSSGGTSTRK